MKRIYFTSIALMATLVASAQTIEVYEYDDNGKLSSKPTYTSSKQVKVVFKEQRRLEYQPIIEGAINHIVEYGQSLSVGGNSVAMTTVAEKGCYMLGTNTRDKKSSVLTPLRNIDGSDDGEEITTGEDMIVSTINTLKYLCLQEGVDTEFLGTSSGLGGMVIDRLSKVSVLGSRYYTNYFLKHIDNALIAAQAANKQIVCPAIMYVQGETDYGPTKEGSAASHILDEAETTEARFRPAIDFYKQKLVQLKNDMQTDIMAKYNQSLKPLFFVHAVGSGNQVRRGSVVNMAQIEACAENDDMILVGAPTFAPHTDVHLSGNGYRWWGGFFAKAIFESIRSNNKFEPVVPIAFRASGKQITIKYNVPCPPLRLDLHTVQNDIPNYGFCVRTPNKSSLLSVAVEGCEVTLTFDKDVSGTYEICYATSGIAAARGNICDSDNWTTLYQYAEDLDPTYAIGEINYRPKDENGQYIFGQNYPMQNWCVPFTYFVTF